jgi:hypothetical protein
MNSYHHYKLRKNAPFLIACGLRKKGANNKTKETTILELGKPATKNSL